jgi:hypothetical protein
VLPGHFAFLITLFVLSTISSASFDCVMVEDVLSFTTRNLKNNLHQGSQSHQLRKILVDEGGKGRGGRLGSCPSSNFCLSVFLCFSQHSQFCVLRPNMVDGQFRMDHVATVYAPEVGFFLNNSDLLVIVTPESLILTQLNWTDIARYFLLSSST